MNKIKELFFPSSQDKLTEKAFNHSIIVSFISIIMCAVLLCSVTFAWFSEDISTSSNIITAGNCTVTVKVEEVIGDVELIPDAEGVYTFSADSVYNIEITSEGTASSSYCLIVVNGVSYYTEQISTKEPYNTISFTLAFDTETKLKIITRWGTHIIPNNERDFYNDNSYLNPSKGSG